MKTILVKTTEIEKLGRLQCTHREAAAFLDIRLHQFRRLLATDKDAREAWEKGLSLGRISIRRKQMRLGGSNANMAIFLGKQYLNQRDVATHEHTGDGPLGGGFDASKLTQEERDELRRLLARRSESSEGAGGA